MELAPGGRRRVLQPIDGKFDLRQQRQLALLIAIVITILLALLLKFGPVLTEWIEYHETWID